MDNFLDCDIAATIGMVHGEVPKEYNLANDD